MQDIIRKNELAKTNWFPQLDFSQAAEKISTNDSFQT